MKKTNYLRFITDVKDAILKSRYSAARMVNRELIALYWRVGKMLSEKTEREKWGAKVVQRIANDLQKELPGLKGFSFSNLKNMRQFYEAYRYLPISQLITGQMPKQISQLTTGQIGQSATAQLMQTSFAQLDEVTFTKLILETGFTHHILLLNKCSNWEEIIFYLQQCHENNWTVSLLTHHLEANLFKRKGAMQSNFKAVLPEQIRQQAIDAFRNQHHLSVDGDDFFVDLLLYNRPLQAMVAVDLKNGKFKPEHAGKMNFYLSALDAQEKFRHENSSIGIILCREKAGWLWNMLSAIFANQSEWLPLNSAGKCLKA